MIEPGEVTKTSEENKKVWPSEGQIGYVYWDIEKNFTEEIIVNVNPIGDGKILVKTKPDIKKSSWPGIHEANKNIVPTKLAGLSFLLSQHKYILRSVGKEVAMLEAKVKEEEKTQIETY